MTNGESAGSTLRQTALGGAVLCWQDALHEGPVPALPRPALLGQRASFLSACGWGSPRELLGTLERRDRQLLAAFREDVEVVLRRALRAVAAGAAAPAEAFVAAQRLEGRPLPPPPPLGDAHRFAQLRLRLTASGARVLDGEDDGIRLRHVDRFVGGTHVTSCSPWRWDPAPAVLVPPPGPRL